MFTAQCTKCRVYATITPKTGATFEWSPPELMHMECPILAETLAGRDNVSDYRKVCTHLDEGMSLAFSRWKRRTSV